MRGVIFNLQSSIFFKPLSILGRCDAKVAFELLAKVGGSETHYAGYLSNGHVGTIGQQFVSFLQANRINVLGESHTIGMIVKKVVEVMTANAETVHNVLTHQVNICIKTLVADSRVNSIKEVFAHVFEGFRCKSR